MSAKCWRVGECKSLSKEFRVRRETKPEGNDTEWRYHPTG
jgi:hypothetical protein